MTVEFNEIVLAFDFVSFGQPYEHQAYLNKETGKIYWESAFGGPPDTMMPGIGFGGNVVGKFTTRLFNPFLPRRSHKVGALMFLNEYSEPSGLTKWKILVFAGFCPVYSAGSAAPVRTGTVDSSVPQAESFLIDDK